jgi:uncharacterized membrane protein YbhN (UPF0104 family)
MSVPMKLRIIQIVLGLACTLLFLTLALYRVPVESVGSAMAKANLIWIGAAIFVYMVNLALRAWRWKITIQSVSAILCVGDPLSDRGDGAPLGYGLNAIMPARLGEFFRAEFLKRSSGLSRVWALTSIVIERIFDGLIVLGFLGLGLLFSDTGTQAGDILTKVLVTGGLLLGGILLVAFSLAGSVISRFFSRFPRLSAQLVMVQRGFGILRTWRTVEVGALTLIIYLPEALSLWFIGQGRRAGLRPFETLVLVAAASLST